MNPRKIFVSVMFFVFVLSGFFAPTVQAQKYPERPIQLIIPIRRGRQQGQRGQNAGRRIGENSRHKDYSQATNPGHRLSWGPMQRSERRRTAIPFSMPAPQP